MSRGWEHKEAKEEEQVLETHLLWFGEERKVWIPRYFYAGQFSPKIAKYSFCSWLAA
jgi:hypothetical protein